MPMASWIIDRNDSPETDAFSQQLERVAARPEVAGLMVLACDANGWTPADVDDLLCAVDQPLFGGVFPGLIHGCEKMDVGSIVVGLTVRPQVLVLPDPSTVAMDCEHFLERHGQPLHSGQTLFVWADGLSPGIDHLLACLYNVFGLEQNYIGGGAGSLSFEQRPCLFTNDGLVEKGAVLASLDVASGVGVSHGWRTVRGPFKVTRAEGAVIHSLDWRPAFDVYREVVEAATGETFAPGPVPENFFDLAKRHPFGIVRLGSEPIVRDPIVARADGSLVCVGTVPTESHVNILSGSTDSLIDAAARSLSLSESTLPANAGGAGRTAVFVDCISRVLFLEDEFSRELAAVARPGRPMVGALTLGEIANNGRDFLEFYNKTAVMALLETP